MKQRTVILLLLHLLSFSVYAQSSSTKALSDYIKKINLFNQLNPQEKVYLHFDNTGYFLGDTIWFKAYTVFAEQHRPTSLSKVLHVELLTPQGEVIDSRKLKIENGQCHGEFPLANSYRSGFYEVRAYTRNMLNFGDSCIFSRVFPVYDTPEAEGDYADKKMDGSFGIKNQRDKEKNRKKNKTVNLAFYPEGGSAVLGLRSRIGFKAWGEGGEDIDIKGAICDASGEPVAFLSTFNQGMGFFDFLPDATAYTVKVEYKGNKYDFPFPEIALEGYVMSVNDVDEDTFQVRLQKSQGLSVDTVAVSVSCRGTVCAVEAMRLGDEPYEYRLSKSQLPAGCLQFTLYDKSGHILAERLSFNARSLKSYRVSVEADKQRYRPFEKVSMSLSLSDQEGNPVNGTFSLSVRDAGTDIYTSYEENIVTNLLLSSDIRGYIANPMQYFCGKDRLTRTKLDLLMMVQGWRRYKWQVMAGISPFNAGHFAEEALPVSGRVMELLRNKAKTGVDVVFWMTKEGAAFHGHCKTDEDGRFYFLLPDSADIKGEWQLGLSVTEKKKQKHCRMMLDRLFSPSARPYSYNDVFVKDTIIVFEDENTDSLENRHFIDAMQYLPQVLIKKRKAEGLKPDIVCDVEKDINRLMDQGRNYPGVLGEYLEDNVPNVRVDGMSGLYRYANNDIYYCFAYKNANSRNRIRMVPPHLRPIENIKRIDVYYKNTNAWVQVSGIEELEVEKDFLSEDADSNMTDLGLGSNLEEKRHQRALRKTFETGMAVDENTMVKFVEEPAVLVLVHLFDDGLHDGYKKGIRHTFFQGYSPVREYYHIDHSGNVPGEVDFRRTLYWNPDVKTDGNGKAQVSFYNNTTCRQMTISAEGLTKQGVTILNKTSSDAENTAF